MSLEIVKVKRNADVDRLIDERIKRALSLMGEVVEGYAKEDCPVDTGNLRNSITHEGREDYTEIVGTNVEYAPYQEFGDHLNHVVGKAHFLRDGAMHHIDELQRTAAATLKGGGF